MSRAVYYEIRHRAGYGSTDHLAGEVIARAARELGLAGAGYARRVGYSGGTAQAWQR